MPRAAHAAALAGALIAAGCASARPGADRPSGAPREAEPDCVARRLRGASPLEGRPVSGRAVFEFWLEADGSPGPVEAVTWLEGTGLEGDAALANEVARAISRCRWVPRTVEGRPARVLVGVPLRFAPSAGPEPEGAGPPAAREEILPPREAIAGCVPRVLPLPPGSEGGAVSQATFLVRVEADGSTGPVAAVGRAGLDPERRRALVEAVAAPAARCRFAPGTVNGRPARAFWLVEVRFTGPAP